MNRLAGRPFAVLNRDGRILVATRICRMFGYGFLSVVLVLYLAALGFGDVRIGVLLTLTLLGDAAISLLLTTRADAVGRRLVLRMGAVLMGGRRHGVRRVGRLLGPPDRRHDRRHQRDRGRGGTVSRRRASVAESCAARPRADADLWLVQPGGFVRHRDGRRRGGPHR